MPIWGWFFIAALVFVGIAILAAVALSAGRRRRTDRLKEQFGPEYDRTVAETGEQQRAEKELVARERKREKLDIRPLSPEAFRTYSHRWRQVQTAFVDDPSSALDDADRLLSEVLRERGYPVDDFEQRAADISVDHPELVQNYRAAHAIHLSDEDEDAATEKHRQAFVHYRALYATLLDQRRSDGRSQTDSAQEASA